MNESRSVTKIGQRSDQETVSRQADSAESRYGGAVHLKCAADLCAQGRSLRQIATELVVPWTAVGRQLRPVGGPWFPHGRATTKINI